MMCGCGWNVSLAEHRDKRALGYAGAIPGHDADQYDDRSQVNGGEDRESQLDGARNLVEPSVTLRS